MYPNTVGVFYLHKHFTFPRMKISTTRLTRFPYTFRISNRHGTFNSIYSVNNPVFFSKRELSFFQEKADRNFASNKSFGKHSIIFLLRVQGFCIVYVMKVWRRLWKWLFGCTYFESAILKRSEKGSDWITFLLKHLFFAATLGGKETSFAFVFTIRNLLFCKI